MARISITTLVREGTMAIPPKEFRESLPFEPTIEFAEDQEQTVSSTQTYLGVFRPTVVWTFDTRKFVIPVTETVQFGWRWLLGIFVGLGLVVCSEFLGAVSAITPTVSVGVTTMGCGLLATLYTAAVKFHYLDRSTLAVETQANKLLGGGVLGVCCLFPPLVWTNLLSVVTALGAVGVVILVLSGAMDDRRTRLNTWVSDLLNRAPRVVIRHTAYSLVATGSLTAYILISTNLFLPAPYLTVAIGGVTGGVVIGLLWYIPTPARARLHAVVAGALSGGYILFVVAELALASRVTAPSLDQRGVFPLTLLGVGLVSLYGSLWWLGIFNPRHVKDEFEAEGRQVGTHTAALFAYLSMMSSGVLCLAAGMTTVVIFRLSQIGMTIGFLIVTLVFLLPLLYFVSGSVYQLRNVLRLSLRFRRHMTTAPVDRIPVDTTQSVKLIPDWILLGQHQDDDSDNVPCNDESEATDPEGPFFVAAYADPFGQYILISESTFERLPEEQLAAVVAHEESHFKYRGAQLQFLFATLPALVLMGKNVVYSIYDFFRREMTADQYAYLRLASVDEITSPDALREVLNRAEVETLPLVDEHSLGFLPTMLTAPSRRTVSTRVEQLFELLFGNFAGDVHPDIATRRRALKVTESRDIQDENDPEERAGLIVQELETRSDE